MARPTPRVSIRVWSTSHNTSRRGVHAADMQPSLPAPMTCDRRRTICAGHAPNDRTNGMDELARVIGTRVRAARVGNRQTQTVVAGLAGITPDYLYQIE